MNFIHFATRGMFDKRVKKLLIDEVQHPYEDFYRKNKELLWSYL
jgi:hypothetical protein